MSWAKLYEHGERRGGFVVRADAPLCDVDIDEFDRVVTRHNWRRPFLGTRLLPGTVLSPLLIQRCAAASVKGEVAADMWTAAWLYGLRSRPPYKPMLVVPRNRGPRREDITIRRTSRWVPDHVTEVRGVPTLRPARLVVDLARDGHSLQTLSELAVGLRRVADLSESGLRTALATYQRPRNQAVVESVADLLEATGGESGLELLGRRRLEECGFRPDARQLTLSTSNGTRRLDIVFAEARVGIEVQSEEYHGNLAAMTRDARKLNAFQDGGEWTILLLTPDMLWGEPWREFIGVLSRALHRAGCGHLYRAA